MLEVVNIRMKKDRIYLNSVFKCLFFEQVQIIETSALLSTAMVILTLETETSRNKQKLEN